MQQDRSIIPVTYDLLRSRWPRTIGQENFGMFSLERRVNEGGDLLNFYIRLNRGGTPHTEQEIERVRQLLVSEQ